MTRSAKQAIDEAQAKLGKECEELLKSSAWNKAHTTTHEGLLERLQMIPKAGLSPMRVVAHRTLKRLGRIPRSHEGHQEDAIAAVRRCGADVNNNPKAVLLFYSHRWKRPNWSEDLGKDLPWASAERQQAMREGKRFGDPDDAARSKAKALIAYGDWLKRFQLGPDYGLGADISGDDDLEIFWWIDWASTDQDAPGPDMAALPAFAAACAGIVAAWSPEYASRAWCQVELLMAHAFMTKGKFCLRGARRLRRRGAAGRQVGHERGGRGGRPRRGPADQRPRPRGDSVAHRRGGALDGLLVLARLCQELDGERALVLRLQRVPLLPVLRACCFGQLPQGAPGPVHRLEAAPRRRDHCARAAGDAARRARRVGAAAFRTPTPGSSRRCRRS